MEESQVVMPQRFGRILRALECGVFFYLLPPSLYFVRHHLAFRVGALVLTVAALCMLYLIRTGAIRSGALWSPAHIRPRIGSILTLFLPVAFILVVLTALFLPSSLFVFPRQAPRIWFVTMVLYPIFAAIPQELIFRVFFFARYGSLFPSRPALVFCNGISFGLAHAFYGNWIALTLSTIGGLLFAYRYNRTQSLLTTSLEHGLWGDFLFTVGIGRFLYSGIIS
ncbi:MAG TPA: type II CAAX endopeptidase family protein [Candidatus Acidoferrum sp.]|nr:type II CAAX endopeptidase family protein [Candidatus Acidoferrum sp.]